MQENRHSGFAGTTVISDVSVRKLYIGRPYEPSAPISAYSIYFLYPVYQVLSAGLIEVKGGAFIQNIKEF